MDTFLFQWMNGWAAAHPVFHPIIRFLAEDAQYLFLLGLLVYGLSRSEAKRRMVVSALLSACVALGFSGLLGTLFYRDRPFVTHTVFQLIPHAANASFPSDHATGAFVVATAIFLFRKKDGMLWLTLAALLALSRVWAGVHYPSDIAAGAALGIVSAAGVHLVFARSPIAARLLEAVLSVWGKWERRLWYKRPSSRKG
ncbi:undecaprenyl-diphosphatase [Paenibacillus sp. J31TS4]|uniref:undecaprenyl-diphosphatase n=1 Tax=Paenibacillus sp. J31TS4 TaxID=2807195 RepID=UPI001B2B5B56|nr:undecaprenyl-diphosphatase [Paenibacillus sp. J31TS4]GIP37115.1 undecaprenyl-diphosphatase [Paenibacillus sp. J31TS4]